MKHQSMSRDQRLDALRGLLLLIMAAVHVPTPVSHALQEPFGFIGNAEGFFFLSACLAGRVYGNNYLKNGWEPMSQRLWGRARVVYYFHIGMVVPVVFIAWALSSRLVPVANHFHVFLVHPWGALALMPLLLHQPPLFDILPLYVILLGATPWLLAVARRCGWLPVLTASFLCWLAAQGNWARLDTAALLPFRWGSFNLFAWQFLWACGVAAGETSVRRKLFSPSSRWWFGVPAALIVAFALMVRHGLWPDTWFPPVLFGWMDKWSLGPLRLLSFGAWAVFLMAWNPRPPGWLLSPTALLGRHSLAVFTFHLPLVIVATTAVLLIPFSTAQQTVVGLLVMFALFPWAMWLEQRRRNRELAASNPAPKPVVNPRPAWQPSVAFQSTGKFVHAILVPGMARRPVPSRRAA